MVNQSSRDPPNLICLENYLYWRKNTRGKGRMEKLLEKYLEGYRDQWFGERHGFL